MRKKYRKKQKNGGIRVIKPGLVVTFIFVMGLLMIWKSNKVKDYYSEIKNLEKSRDELKSENSGLKAELMDLKSITRVGTVVKKYGLTQNVAERLTIKIPMVKDVRGDRKFFVDMDIFADWLEEAVFRSGRINAQDNVEK
jgi:cell division protein FtsL